jgi:hypothetical protein
LAFSSLLVFRDFDDFQYVNYSSITLKAGGPTTLTDKDGKPTKVQVVEQNDIEGKINKAILKIPECGQCRNCTEKNTKRKLCEQRLEVRCKLVAAETKKLEGVKGSEKKESKKRKADGGNVTGQSPPLKKPKVPQGPRKRPPKLMQNSGGELKPRVTSQGNKRMAIPDDLFPDFCRRISAEGTGERMKVITKFAEDHPTISVRQVTIKLGEVTTKDRPECIIPGEKTRGRSFMFYLRPRFYKYLPPDERPDEWEKYAEEDEAKYQEEKLGRMNGNGEGGDADSNNYYKGSDVTSEMDMTSDVESATSSQPDIEDDDGEETEDEEAEPVSKRLKMD